MSTPLISVIVPVYNAEKYLCKCIESIQDQTYSKLEIVLVDDGSTDSSGCICQTYAQKDARIKVIQKANGGQASARNLALDQVSGEYIGFVDADDWLEPDMYERLMKAVEQMDVPLVMCGRYNVDEKKGTKHAIFAYPGRKYWTQEEMIRRFLLTDGIDGSPCDKLIKKELVDNIRFPEGYICEDIPFIYEIIKNATGICHIGVAMYNYLQRTGSTSKPTRISEKTKGLVLYPEQIRQNVIQECPNLRREADAFYFSRLLFMNNLLIRSGERKLGRVYKKKLVDCFGAILANPYLSKTQKLYATAFFTGTYGWIRHIKNFLRGKL